MSPTIVKLCATCRVAKVTKGRCGPCQRAYEAGRGSGSARGYGAAHRAVRLAVLQRDGWRCHWCGRPANEADHLVPLHLGGATTAENLVASCRRCNAGRR